MDSYLKYCGNAEKPGGKRKKQISILISGEIGLLDSKKYQKITPERWDKPLGLPKKHHKHHNHPAPSFSLIQGQRNGAN